MDQVTETREPVFIWRRGKESVALIAVDEVAGWMKSAYLLRSPKNARPLLQVSHRVAEETGEPTDIDELRTRLGLANS